MNVLAKLFCQPFKIFL